MASVPTVVFLLLAVVFLIIWRAIRSARRHRELAQRILELQGRLDGVEQEVRELARVLQGRPAQQPVSEPVKTREAPAQSPASAPSELESPAIDIPLSSRSGPQVVETPAGAKVSRSPQSAPRFATSRPAGLERWRTLLNLEETLGTNWLNKLGIIILVIGVALFLAYQLGAMGPAGKVSVGYLTGAAVLGAGVFFERRARYRILARAAIGGGWALLFFTTYAMYHVAASRVVSSQAADLGLMLAVASLMVVHTLHYRSQAVTSLAFLLAFSTITISHVSVYSLAADAVLALSLVIIVIRMRWFVLEIFGILASYFNHYLWLRTAIGPRGPHPHFFPAFLGSTGLLIVYWAVFRASYLMRRIETPREERVSGIAALLNPLLLLLLIKYQSIRPAWAFWFLLFLGAAELLLGQLPVARRRRTAFVILSALGGSLLVLAFPFRYSGQHLSAFWLAESEALILAGVFGREKLFRTLGTLAALITAAQMLCVDTFHVFAVRWSAGGAGHVASETGLGIMFTVAALVFYVNGHWLSLAGLREPANGMSDLFLDSLSYVAGLMAVVGAWLFFPKESTAVAWAAIGVMLFEAGLARRTRSLRIQAYAILGLGFVRICFVNLNGSSDRGEAIAALTTLPLVLACYYVYGRLAGPGYETLEWDRRVKAAPVYAFLGTLSLAALLRFELVPNCVAPGWAALALILVAIAWRTRRHVFLQQGLLMAFAVLIRTTTQNLSAEGSAPASLWQNRAVSVTVVIVLLSLALAAILRSGPRKQVAGHAPRRWYGRVAAYLESYPEKVFFFISFILSTWLLAVELRHGLVTLGWGLQAVAVFIAALALGQRSFRLTALGLLLICVLKIALVDVWGLTARDRYVTFIALGAALLAVSFLYSKYREVLREYL